MATKKTDTAKEVKAEVKDTAVAEKKAPAKKAAAKAPAAKAPAAKKAPAKKAAVKAPAAVIIQSPLGGEITAEEILARVGEVDKVYVRVDENKAYWVRGEETGSVELW